MTISVKGGHFWKPITPLRGQFCTPVHTMPALEARRAGLETNIPLWVIVDKVNTDIWERSYYLADRAPQGRFSEAFTRQVLQRLRHELSRNQHMVSR